MSANHDDAGLAARLTGPVANVLDQQRDAVQRLLGGESGEAMKAAVQNDENVRKVATFCYPLLPGLLRLAVKEPAFVSFVLNHREKLLLPLAKTQAA